MDQHVNKKATTQALKILIPMTNGKNLLDVLKTDNGKLEAI